MGIGMDATKTIRFEVVVPMPMKKTFTLILLFVGSLCSWGQNRTTSQNGAWNDVLTWNNLSVPNAAFGTVTVNHSVTVDAVDFPIGAPLQIDQIVIGASGSLTIEAGAAIQIMNGTGTDVSVNASGQLTITGGSEFLISGGASFNTTTGNTTFSPGSVVRASGANLPLATGLDAIDIYLEGIFATLTLGSSWNQLGVGTNLTVNCPGLASGQISFAGFITSLNSLSILDTDAENTGRVVLTTGTTAIAIGTGGVHISGDSRLQLTTTGNVTVSVAGDFNFSSTSTNASQNASTGIGILNVEGSFNQTSGNWYLASGTAGTGFLSLTGNNAHLNVTGGMLGETGSGTASATFTFAGAINDQNFNWPVAHQVSGGTYHLEINKPSGSVLQTNALDIAGLTLSSGNLVTNGNDLTLRGDVTQTAGLLDCTIPTNLTINGTGVLPASLNFQPGSLLANLTLKRSGALLALMDVSLDDLALITISAGTITSPLVAVNRYDILYSNTAALTSGGEVPVSASVLRNLTHAGTATVTLASGTTINGNLTIHSNTLAAASNNISLSGNVITNGPFTQSAGATLEFLGAIPHSISGTGTAAFGGLTTHGDLSVANTSVTLVGGDLTLNAGASLNHTNGTFAFSFPVNGNASILSSGSAIQFKNLSIGTGDSLTAPLNSLLQISGNWSGGGTFVHNGSTVHFNGTTALTGSTKTFNDVNILSSSSLSGTSSIRILGNLDNQGLVNITGGTCTWNSSGTLSGSGPVRLNRLTISGTRTLNLDLNSTLTLSGNLTLTGNLVQTQAFPISIQGNMSGNGAITTAGAIVFTGATSAMAGTGAKNFQGLAVAASGATLTVGAGTSYTILNGGTLDIIGTLNTTAGGNSTLNIPGAATVLNTGVSTTVTNLNITGTFSASSGILWLNGNFVNNGTFNHDLGTIGFTSSGSATKNITAASTVEFNNLTINNNGNAVDVANNVTTGNLLLRGVLTLSDAVFDADGTANNKVFVLQSLHDSPTQDASIASMSSLASVTGNITVQRFMGDHDEVNRYVAAPVSGTTLAGLTDNFTPVRGLVTWYRESVAGTSNKGYVSGGATTPLTPGAGYLVMPVAATPDVTLDFIGPLTTGLNAGDVNLNPTYTPSTPTALPSDDGWNLVGNPYPSGIIWTNNPAQWTVSNIENVITVPDLGGNHFYSWDASIGMGDLPGGVISMGQAFWVKANAPAPSLVVHENAKTSASGAFFRKKTETPSGIKITLEHEGLRDNSFLLVRESSSFNYDALDGAKYQNDQLWVGMLSPEGTNLAHNAVPTLNADIPVNLFIQKENAVLTLKFENLRSLPDFEELHLVDIYLGKSQALTQPYTFTVSPSKASREGRFYLSKEPWGAEKPLVQVLVYPNPTKNEIWIESGQPIIEIEILNAKGDLVMRLHNIEPTDNQKVDLKSLLSGLYFVAVKTRQGVKTQKVFKEN